MKPQPTKKLFAFIIIMMFSCSFLQAQVCKGDKVLMHIGSYSRCHSMCVPSSQVGKYLAQGWFYGSCPPIFPGVANCNTKVPNEKIPNKQVVTIPDNNAIASNKIFRR
jgi:hypothetical protein